MSESQVTNSEEINTESKPEPKPAPKKAKGKKVAKEAQSTESEVGGDTALKLVLWDSGVEPELVQLPDSPTDPRWDVRMMHPLDPVFVQNIAVNGVQTPISVSPIDGGRYAVNSGRTRLRAISEANKLRAKAKPPLPALIVPLIVKATTDHEAMLLSVSENEMRRQSKPSEKADIMLRMIDSGIPEKEICGQFGVTGPKLHEYLTIASIAPDAAREALDAGTISFSGLVSILHLDEGKINAAVAQVIKAQELGVRLPTKKLKEAAGQSGEPDRPTAKMLKAFVEDLKTATDIEGKHGDAARKGALYALELALDTRKRDGFMKKLRELAKG